MRPGAILMLSSPNLKSLTGMVNFLIRNRACSASGRLYDEYKKLETLGHMGHVREYTTTEIIEFLEDGGFEVTRVIYRGRFSTKPRRALIRLVPSLSPFVSYIAMKPKHGRNHV